MASEPEQQAGAVTNVAYAAPSSSAVVPHKPAVVYLGTKRRFKDPNKVRSYCLQSSGDDSRDTDMT